MLFNKHLYFVQSKRLDLNVVNASLFAFLIHSLVNQRSETTNKVLLCGTNTVLSFNLPELFGRFETIDTWHNQLEENHVKNHSVFKCVSEELHSFLCIFCDCALNFKLLHHFYKRMDAVAVVFHKQHFCEFCRHQLLLRPFA